MRPTADWNCRLLPGFDGAPADPLQAADALSLLSRRTGLVRFCMMPVLDLGRESVTAFLLRRDRAVKKLRETLPPELSILPAAAVSVFSGLEEERELDRLLPPLGRLPILLPPGDPSILEPTLGHLAYRRGLPLLFLSFDTCMLFSPEEPIERLLRLQNAAFQFGLRSLAREEVCRAVKALQASDRPILLGSAINRFEKAGYCDLDTPLRECSRRLRDAEVRRLLSESNAYASGLF